MRHAGVCLLFFQVSLAWAAPEPSPDADAVGPRPRRLPVVRSVEPHERYVLPAWAEVELPAREPLPPVPIYHGSRASMRVALTFDACSTKDSVRYEPRITEILLATDTPATLFLGGKWMTQEPDLVRELAEYPQFELGLHAHAHPWLTRLSDGRIQQELLAADRVLYALTGRRAELYRPPFGDVDDRVVRAAAELGYATVMYDVASGDPDAKATAPRLVSWLSRTVTGGSIVVMHINRRGRHTAAALEEIIATLRAKGYVFVTLSELLRDDEPSAPVVHVDLGPDYEAGRRFQ